MKSFARVFMILAMVICMAVPAMALDQSACNDPGDEYYPAFVYSQSPNVQCLGRLEAEDMGHLYGGAWVWDQAFLDEYYPNSYSQVGTLFDPEYNESRTIVMTEGRIDNRAWAESKNRDPDSRFVFQGKKSDQWTLKIPSIWKFEVTAGVGITNELIPINDSGIGYFMDELQGAPGHPVWINVDFEYTPIKLEDIASVYWHEGDQTRLPYYSENDYYYYMSYDMGSQRFTGPNLYIYNGKEYGPSTSTNNIYFQPFDGQIPVGMHTFTLNLKNGVSDTWTINVESNTLMPVVDKYTEGLEFIQIKNKGKSKKKTKNITIANLIANTMTNDYGEEILVIQFAEPDRAMELVSPIGGGVKLRIWVADPDMVAEHPVGSNFTTDFVFLNAPLHAGSIVVPPEAWAWIKSRPDVQAAGEVVVGGMYREQFYYGTFAYHNRGYIEPIHVPIQ